MLTDEQIAQITEWLDSLTEEQLLNLYTYMQVEDEGEGDGEWF